MKLKKNYIIISIIAIGLLAFIFFLVKKNKAKALGMSTDESPSASSASADYTKTKAKFPLVYGSKGSQIAEFQKHCNKINTQEKIKLWDVSYEANPVYGFKNLSVDGIWGKDTDKYIKALGFNSPISQELYNDLIKLIK